MNPAISVNTLLLGQVSRDVPTAEANQFNLQEVEIQFSSVIDPFWTADLIISVHPEEDPDHEGFGIGIEKAMAEYENMPRGFGLRVGLDFLSFGKHNTLHAHQFTFVEAPVAISSFLGDENISGAGAEVLWTVPLPWWAELKAYGMKSGSEVFDADSRDLVYGARLSNLWDVSAEGTLELGLSGLSGPGAASDLNDPAGQWNMYGADLTYKRTAIAFTNEVLLPDPEEKQGDPLGFYSHLQYRVARTWWLGVGGGFARDAAGEDGSLMTLTQYQANATFVPSEFSSVRVGVHYDEDTDSGFRDLGASIQFNFTLGSHPAHLY